MLVLVQLSLGLCLKTLITQELELHSFWAVLILEKIAISETLNSFKLKTSNFGCRNQPKRDMILKVSTIWISLKFIPKRNLSALIVLDRV